MVRKSAHFTLLVDCKQTSLDSFSCAASLEASAKRSTAEWLQQRLIAALAGLCKRPAAEEVLSAALGPEVLRDTAALLALFAETWGRERTRKNFNFKISRNVRDFY